MHVFDLYYDLCTNASVICVLKRLLLTYFAYLSFTTTSLAACSTLFADAALHMYGAKTACNVLSVATKYQTVKARTLCVYYYQISFKKIVSKAASSSQK